MSFPVVKERGTFDVSDSLSFRGGSVYGIYTQGSQAAIEYITSAQRLPELRKALMAASPNRSSPPPYFQALLETTVENYVPGKALLVAVRVFSN